MRFYRTINAKLTLLTAVAAGVALWLSLMAFFINDVQLIRGSKVHEFSTLAAILGANAMPAIERNDAKTATELLASLRRQPSVEFACLYDASGELFATYPADLPDGFLVPPPASAGGAAFVGSDRLEITGKRVAPVLEPGRLCRKRWRGNANAHRLPHGLLGVRPPVQEPVPPSGWGHRPIVMPPGGSCDFDARGNHAVSR